MKRSGIKRPTRTAAALSAALTLTSFGCDAGAQEWSGEYTVATSEAIWTLVLEVDSDGSAYGILNEPGVGAHTLTGAHDGDELTGQVVSTQRPGEFEIYFDEDVGHFFFVLTPLGTDGTAQVESEVEWPMVPGHGEQALAALASLDTQPPAVNAPESTNVVAPVTAGQRDPRLIGLWRTVIVVSDPVATIMQDLFLEFRNDGVMVQRTGGGAFGSSGGSITGTGGEVETAEWRTIGDELQLRLPSTRWVPIATVYIAGQSLLLSYYDGERRVWTRM